MPFWRTIHSMPLGRGKHETIGFLARTHTRTCTHTHRHTRACSHTFAYCDECHMGCILKWKWPAVIYIAKTTLTFDLCFICLLALHFHIFPCINAQDDLSEFKLRKPQWWTLNQCYWPGEAEQIFSRVLITGNKKPLRQAGGSCLL